MSIALIIPARNEALALPLLIPRIPTWVDEVIVVDNASTDGTGQIAADLGCHVVRENRIGYGAAVWAGIQASRAHILVFASADGSDPVERLGDLIRPLQENQAAFVFAQRVAAAGAMSPLQQRGNALASRLIQWRWGSNFGDLGPFRALTRDTLLSLNMQDRGFGWTMEMQAKIAARQIKWQAIPLPYALRSAGTSKISGTFTGTLQASGAIIWTFLILALKRQM